MRPRVFPAEDRRDRRQVGGLLLASMRPRVFPAEDVVPRAERLDRPVASMRPRVFPAEDGAVGTAQCSEVNGFNEAAGIPRGRR